MAGDVIIVGAAHLPGSTPVSRTNEKGYVRGFDAQTGERLWIFHTIPTSAEFGFDSWEGDSASYTGNTGVWAQISVDEELGLAYLPVEMPTGDYYGGHRPGDGLFGESLIAIDLRTGERRWHHQFIHHGIWDWDLPCAPIIADLTVDGRPIPAVIQPTKQGWLYVFNRVTGEPVWPIEEREVEQSTVPLEETSPTQPFVTKPPPFDRQGVSIDDLINFTPELRAEAEALVSRYKIGPLFTPPVVSRWEGPLATLMMPSTGGGANWPGGGFDPETSMLYVHSSTVVSTLGLVESDGVESDMALIRGMATDPGDPAAAAADGNVNLTVQGLPLIKPPYGRITAFDMTAANSSGRSLMARRPTPSATIRCCRGSTFPAPDGPPGGLASWSPARWSSRASRASSPPPAACAARCCGPTTRPPVRRSDRSTRRHPRRGRR